MIKHIKTNFVVIENSLKYQYLLLIVITLVAAVLRFYKLDEWSFWIEEHHSLWHASRIDFSERALFYPHSLFYLPLKLVLILLGINEWTTRLLSVLIGITTIPILYWIVKRIFGSPVALLVATLMAVSPWHLYWSQNARFYTLVLLMYTLSLFSFYWAIEKDQIRYIIASVAALVLAVKSHEMASLLVPIFGVYFLALKVLPFEKPPGLRLRNLMPFIILPLVGYSFLEAYLFVAGKSPFLNSLYLQFFNESTASFIGYANPYVMLTAVVYYIGVPLAFLSLFGSIYQLKEKKRIGLLLSLGAFLPLFTMMLLTLFASTGNRYVFMTLPCWIILGVVAVKELYVRANKGRIGILVWIMLGILVFLLKDPVVEDILYYTREEKYFRLFVTLGAITCLIGALLLSRFAYTKNHRGVLIWGLGILFIILVHPALTDTLYYAFQHGHRDNWKAASATIRQVKVDEDVIVSTDPPELEYYIGREKIKFRRSVDLDVILQDSGRFWFVEDPGSEHWMSDGFKEWMETNCDLVNVLDQYTAGRNWKLRVHLCNPGRELSRPKIATAYVRMMPIGVTKVLSFQ